MAKISSSITREKYKVHIKSPSGNVLIADEPVAVGGQDLGFSPKELLASSLAACTSATVKMYAEGKAWPLDEVKIGIDLEWDESQKRTTINRKIEFIGNLDDRQRRRLLSVAIACPLHKILSHPIDILTTATT